jgi:ABC-2 type transport system permease protein
MNARRLRAMTRKEFLQILRDPFSPILALLIPVVLLLMFGYALTLDIDNVPLAVWDRAGTTASRALMARFTASPYFRVFGVTAGYQEIERAIDLGRAKAALVIPSNFDRQAAGRPVALQLVVDGSDPTVGTLVENYAEAVVDGFAAAQARSSAARAGAAPRVVTPELRPRIWYNADMETKNAIVPGLIATILSVIAALLTSLTVAREWETGTMEQLIATPVTAGELLAGKLIPYFLIGMVDVAIAVALGHWVFQVPLRGSPLLVFGLAAVFLLATLGTGILISVVTRSQLLASQVAMAVTLLPSFLLSGLVFSISSMPWPLRYLSALFPARYFVTLLRAIYLKGLGLAGVAGEASLLTAFAAAVLTLAVMRFEKRLR